MDEDDDYDPLDDKRLPVTVRGLKDSANIARPTSQVARVA